MTKLEELQARIDNLEQVLRSIGYYSDEPYAKLKAREALKGTNND